MTFVNKLNLSFAIFNLYCDKDKAVKSKKALFLSTRIESMIAEKGWR